MSTIFRPIFAAAMLALATPAFAHQSGMMDSETVDLSHLPPDQQVVSLSYCDAVYRLTTREGDPREFPEFNLRFKTDASDMGPPQGTPALLPAGMMGDRALIIFASPAEISSFIAADC